MATPLQILTRILSGATEIAHRFLRERRRLDFRQ